MKSKQGRRETRPVPAPLAARLNRRRGTPVALRVLASGAEVAIPDGIERFGIGSDASNHLVIEDRFVSAFHCVLERRGPGTWLLRDRRSTNGTYVDGVRVGESQVGPGSRIVVGGTALSLVGPHGGRADGLQRALDALVGMTPEFKATVERTLRAAASSQSVLLTGESGTGKELFARLIHEASGRAGGPFVAVNCGAIASTLVESELFGHEKGAFTGASERRAGVFEQADGGTLFLDEIGELPLKQQPKLLRVLESRRVQRVGGVGEREVDVRIVSATHQDIDGATEAGDWRLDLFHRLAVIQIRIPALRERPGDIPLLARRFLEEVSPEIGARKIDAETMRALMRHQWPGNVRELKNAIRRAAAMGEGKLALEDLLPDASRPKPVPPLGALVAPSPTDDELLPDGVTIDDLIKETMARALARFGSQRSAARALGMSRSTFHERVHRYGLLGRLAAGTEPPAPTPPADEDEQD